MFRRRTSSARGGGLVEHAPQRAFAQVDVAALPEPLEARERDAAGVVVLLDPLTQFPLPEGAQAAVTALGHEQR